MRILIVGQGLAGTLLHYFLWKKGCHADIIDQGHTQASTALAAGIINPVTGRNPRKAWMIDHLWPVAKRTYLDLDLLLSPFKEAWEAPLWTELLFYRPLKDTAACNDWDATMHQTGMDNWVREPNPSGLFNSCFPDAHWGVVQAARVNVSWMIRAYRKWILASKKHGLFYEGILEAGQLQLNGPKAIFQAIEYDVVVGCTGAFRQFQWWPEQWILKNKGEALLVEAPEQPMEGMLKAGILVAPVQQKTVWVGTRDSWNPEQDGPTREGHAHLTSGWEQVFRIPPKVLHHGAAFRPVTRDRRPIMGWKRGTPWAIFNGLGTKGSSLGPYWAERMAALLLDNEEIPGEVGIERFS